MTPLDLIQSMFSDFPNRVMVLDNETWSTRANALVANMGFVVYDKTQRKVIYAEELALAKHQQLNRHIDPSTLQWWATKVDSLEARERAFLPDTKAGCVNAGLAIDVMANAYEDFECKGFVGNSPRFDIAQYESLVEDFGGRIPYNFYEERDLREVLRVLPHVREAYYAPRFVPLAFFDTETLGALVGGGKTAQGELPHLFAYANGLGESRDFAEATCVRLTHHVALHDAIWEAYILDKAIHPTDFLAEG